MEKVDDLCRHEINKRQVERYSSRRSGFCGRLSSNIEQTSSKTILVVDDEPILLRLTTKLFSSAEYKVTSAHNAKRAARFVDSIRFYAVFTDYQMPDKDGIWLLQYVRNIQPDTRRVLTSGITPPGLEKHVHSGLVEQFVSKPSTREGVLRSLFPKASVPSASKEMKVDNGWKISCT